MEFELLKVLIEKSGPPGLPLLFVTENSLFYQNHSARKALYYRSIVSIREAKIKSAWPQMLNIINLTGRWDFTN